MKSSLTKKQYDDLLSELRKLDKWTQHKIAPLVHYCSFLRSELSKTTTELNRIQNLSLIETNEIKLKTPETSQNGPNPTVINMLKNLKREGKQGGEHWLLLIKAYELTNQDLLNNGL